MKIVLVGVGRTGSHTAQLLAPKLRARDELVIVDRDALEESNLDGCALYAKRDIGKLKANLLAEKISTKTKAKVTPASAHLSPANISTIFGTGKNKADLILDCTDNWQTRTLINEYCWKNKITWIYSGALENRAMCTVIFPRDGACFACWAQKPIAPISCSEVGVAPRALRIISKVQVAQALAILKNRKPTLKGIMFFFHRGSRGKEVKKTVTLEKKTVCLFCVKGRSLYGEQEAIVTCGGNEWMFQNNFREKNAKEIYKKLEGFERKVFGEVVKVTVGKTTATVFANGTTMVRAKNREHASAANQAIAQKIA